jgi:hypothetical protein
MLCFIRLTSKNEIHDTLYDRISQAGERLQDIDFDSDMPPVRREAVAIAHAERSVGFERYRPTSNAALGMVSICDRLKWGAEVDRWRRDNPA